jgi:hypothetical protein
MRSEFVLTPVIDFTAVGFNSKGFVIKWTAPTNVSFQVEYSPALPATWETFTNIVTSATGDFRFVDDGSESGGLSTARFYRVHTAR